jgi:hypothetical protein
MAHPSFNPTFHPTFLSMSHAWEESLMLLLVLSLTLIRHILAHNFHRPVKTPLNCF